MIECLKVKWSVFGAYVYTSKLECNMIIPTHKIRSIIKVEIMRHLFSWALKSTLGFCRCFEKKWKQNCKTKSLFLWRTANSGSHLYDPTWLNSWAEIRMPTLTLWTDAVFDTVSRQIMESLGDTRNILNSAEKTQDLLWHSKGG